MRSLQQDGLSALALAMVAVLAGCGTPGAPLPPSLNLPDRVADLAATRAGDHVSLTWTMPKKNTDKLLLKDDVAVHICRQEEHTPCVPVTDIRVGPGAAATFADSLSRSETEGAPRVLTYFVELKNRNGRSAGLSNGGVVLAGLAPAQVTGLTAEVRKTGIVLRWQPGSENEAVRLHRTLLTPPPAKAQQGLLAQAREPVDQNLLIEAGPDSSHIPDRALDKNIRFGETYAYRAQRVVSVVENGQTLELAGELSALVRVEALDVFPPAVPAGLAAVATVGESGGETAIDLSWQPDTEDDLAGYIVYRLQGDGVWQRISPAQPVVGPAFHDTQVQRSNTYRYAVTAIDQSGHESARSAEAEETVPGP